MNEPTTILTTEPSASPDLPCKVLIDVVNEQITGQLRGMREVLRDLRNNLNIYSRWLLMGRGLYHSDNQWLGSVLFYLNGSRARVLLLHATSPEPPADALATADAVIKVARLLIDDFAVTYNQPDHLSNQTRVEYERRLITMQTSTPTPMESSL